MSILDLPLGNLLGNLLDSVPVVLAAADLLYALPLLVVYSLVRAASRYEDRRQILMGAARSGAVISVLLLLIFLVLEWLDWTV